jgi:2-C-methyl-D-erythritol 4-phosphate cytidylyltransferase
LSFALLVPAAGSGARLGADKPKALLELNGEPLFVLAIRPFLKFVECRGIVVAVPRESLDDFEAAKESLQDSRVRIIAGGATRQDSVGKALDALLDSYEAVAVHDAARPLVTRDLIEAVLTGLDAETTAVLPGLPATDTLKLVKSGGDEVEATLPRERIYAVQTPQLIRTEPFREAHRKASANNFQASDDVALIEAYKLGRVKLVPGDDRNFKITTPADLERARSLLTADAATTA